MGERKPTRSLSRIQIISKCSSVVWHSKQRASWLSFAIRRFQTNAWSVTIISYVKQPRRNKSGNIMIIVLLFEAAEPDKTPRRSWKQHGREI